MKHWKIFICISILLILALFFSLWNRQMEACRHFSPDYEKADLSHILQKDFLSAEDYRLLFYQTGLAKSAVDTIRSTDNDSISTLLDFQTYFFQPAHITCKPNTIISREERMTAEKAMLAPYENADILITNASHVLLYRNGHAGLVIDAQKGKTLEAVVLGSDSSIQDISKWMSYPNFILLRLKHGNDAVTKNICTTAQKQLCGIPYHLTSGLIGPALDEHTAITGTHCSHLVWSAYYLNGFNLDSDGGRIVTPNDIRKSNALEIVQIYGLDPSNYMTGLAQSAYAIP